MARLRLFNRSSVLWIGGFGFLVGSLLVGSSEFASANPPPSTVNQGAPNSGGTQAWPVSGSVGVSSLPSVPPGSNTIGDVGVAGALPPGTNTIGNVGVTGSLPSGSNTIGNVGLTGPLPSGSANIGHVNVDNFPATQQVAAVTRELSSGVPTISAGDSSVVNLDASSYGAVRLYLVCFPTNSGDCPLVHVRVLYEASGGHIELLVDTFTLGDFSETTKTYDLPPPNLRVQIVNGNGSDSVTIPYVLDGRTN